MNEILDVCPYCLKNVTVNDHYIYCDENGRYYHTLCYVDWREEEMVKKYVVRRYVRRTK